MGACLLSSTRQLPWDTHGGYPYAGLILSGDTLYGTARGGGLLDVDPGTVFAVNTNGTSFRQLYVSVASGSVAPQVRRPE